MPVTQQENETYRQFVSQVAIDLGVFDMQGQEVVWHYTNGEGFLGILQSSTLYASQVSALNDARETEYATDLFKQAVKEVIAEKCGDERAVAFMNRVVEMVKGEPENPTRGISKFFVTSFSAEGDDVIQWARYARNGSGYAIGFFPRGLNREHSSQLFRVVYDRGKQERAAKTIAEATLRFYLEGLDEERTKDPELWAREFFQAWDEWVYRLAPLAKDPKWKAESEYRIVHELKVAEFPQVRFVQKRRCSAAT